MKFFLTFFLVFLVSFSVSAKVCHYDIQSPALKWTGYKFTSKDPVSGNFKQVEWGSLKKASSAQELMQSMTFWADGYSIDAGNEARNYNLTESLFKFMPGGRFVRGFVKSVSSKYMVVTLSLGEKVFSVPLRIKKKGNDYTLVGQMDFLKAGLKKAFDSVHEQCKDLHTGKDGKAKTWSTIDFVLTFKIQENCQ